MHTEVGVAAREINLTRARAPSGSPMPFALSGKSRLKIEQRMCTLPPILLVEEEDCGYTDVVMRRMSGAEVLFSLLSKVSRDCRAIPDGRAIERPVP
jgi:hypothetical protein